MEMVEDTSWPELLHNRSVKIAMLKAENMKKDAEIEALKQRIAELEAPSPPPEAMDLNSYQALRVVLDHSRDQAMRELMGKIGSMQEDVEQFHQTVETAGFDFDIEHAANVLNKKLAAAGHPHRVDVEELIANTPFSTLGDWFMCLIQSSELHSCDNSVRMPQDLLPFARHPDVDEPDSDENME
jgi:hypothetical protein